MGAMAMGPNIRVIVTDGYEQMSAKAAGIMAEELLTKPDAVLGFATGSSPVGLYAELVAMHKSGELCFAKATSFNLDEYYPISRTSGLSYHYYMKKHLFGCVNIREECAHVPNGECADAQAECEAYEAMIASAGGIDIQLLGIGENGHIAFNEPAECFPAATYVAELEESLITANRRFFASKREVPRHAITMGIRSIMLARKILLIASGSKKADVVARTLCGDITPALPASVLQLHQHVTVVLDKAAAEKLPLTVSIVSGGLR